ncbi:hypothetical protein VPNG_05011 [Cytospora leucostoma]|uniref:Uncharacterized protein n=1 Tax=Cytospora leucostoma TaxID=1230097 RepID=A0A423X7A5_9PEZI|nr:hypothetical protein VPNG_05011 [Cytospora leucostoma]
MHPSTWTQLKDQWANPADVLTVLMIIGGDVVRTALAQSTGTLFTPVCFSFGWVAYAFMALIAVIGDGRLLPPPDYAVKVFNLNSGYVRDNKNWVIGRIMRDHEAKISKAYRCERGIRITIYDAKRNKNVWTKFSYDWTHVFGLFWMVVQLAVAAIPAGIDGDWTVLLVTGVGTCLALVHSALPQWTAEKLPNRQHANFIFALTTGNGSKDIMIVKGQGCCLHLEEFAVTDTPRNARPWEKFSKYKPLDVVSPGKPLTRTASGFLLYGTREALGIPLAFWITLLTSVSQTLIWLALLITVASIRSHTWYLLLVGCIGMFQNGIIAAIERPPSARNLPISRTIDGPVAKDGVIIRDRVMDALMDLTVELGSMDYVRPLVREFFPGSLRPEEHDWWAGNKSAYDSQRMEEQNFRGIPAGKDVDTQAAQAGIAHEIHEERLRDAPSHLRSTFDEKRMSPAFPSSSDPASPRMSARLIGDNKKGKKPKSVSFASTKGKEVERPGARGALFGATIEMDQDLEFGMN